MAMANGGARNAVGAAPAPSSDAREDLLTADGPNGFARAFGEALAVRPDAPFLLARDCADERGGAGTLSYAQVSARADALLRGLALRLSGEFPAGGSRLLPICLDNGPYMVALVLAAARGGLTLVTLNPRLSDAERRLRIEALAEAMDGELPDALRERDLVTLEAAGRAAPGPSPDVPVPGRASAVVMFTSGTTGTPKAVPLTWDNLCGSALAANERLGCRPGSATLWQASLPMCHVGGLQMLVRSVLAGRPLALYRRFDAGRILDDARELGATHVSVVDKTLRDLLDADDARGREGGARALPGYRCILLGGSAPNASTLARATRAGARVLASYGMTETSSLVACGPCHGYDGWLELLPGYEARAVEGGQIAVRGPGVTDGYLNAPTPRSEDGMLLTGDVGEVDAAGARVRVGERTGDMFVSGGENVYPAEVEDVLRSVPGVDDAYVYGAPDERWGRRPVAFVESRLSPGSVRERLEGRLSRLNMPDRLYATASFPRMGIGKVDRSALRRADETHVEVSAVELFEVEQRLVTPFVTAKVDMRSRTSLIVRVTDHAGRRGLGECVAFPTPWYLPETLPQDIAALVGHLVPAVLGRPFLDAREVAPSLLAEIPPISGLPMALGALEPALWDVWAQACELPLWEALLRAAGEGDESPVKPGPLAFPVPLATPAPLSTPFLTDAPGLPASRAGDGGSRGTLSVACGDVVGIAGVAETLDDVARHVALGSPRVKLKVRPGDDVVRVRAVREAFPSLMLTLDANQSYGPGDVDALRGLDELGVTCVEEPLAPLPGEGRDGLWGRLESLQALLGADVCLDESMASGSDAWRALRDHPALRCFAVKIGKFGGVGPALDFCRAAGARGARVWMGGMFETSVSKRHHAAFEVLPWVDVPGDISATSRYFPEDVASPALTTPGGRLVLNDAGHPLGLGCDLDEEVLGRVCVRRWRFEA